MNISEEQFLRWSRAPSETEETKCQSTFQRIKKALESKFGSNISIFLQGSYKNRTNVKLDSDVDIVALYKPVYFPDVSFLSDEDKKIFWSNFTPSQYTFSQYKNAVQEVLENEFDSGEVKRKDRCIKVIKNAQRVDADVVPCFEHHRYETPYSVNATGIEFMTDLGVHIIGFPDQHYDNGVLKNSATKQKFKSIVRILKNTRNNMIDEGLITDKAMPSFLIECLVWNIGDEKFDYITLTDCTRSVLANLFNNTIKKEDCWSYAEVSNLKWLFRGESRWTNETANTFLGKTWGYLGYD